MVTHWLSTYDDDEDEDDDDTAYYNWYAHRHIYKVLIEIILFI